jgi:hypothetical protein
MGQLYGPPLYIHTYKDFGNTTNYILIKHIFIILYTSRGEARIA